MRNDIYVQTLYNNMYSLRTKHGLSRHEMAQLLGVEEGVLTQMESGLLPPELTIDSLVRFGRHFNIELYRLFLPLEL